MIPSFDPQARKYKCCCGRCHVKKGMLIIGIIGAVWEGFSFLGSLFDEYNGPKIFQLVLACVVYGCLFYGLHKEEHNFLKPYIIMQVFMVVLICLGIVLILLIYVGAAFLASFVLEQLEKNYNIENSGNSTDVWSAFAEVLFGENSTMMAGDQEIENAGTGALLIGILAVAVLLAAITCLLIQLWFMTIALGCYRYLRDKDRFGTAPDGQKRLSVAYFNQGGAQISAATPGHGPPQGYHADPQPPAVSFGNHPLPPIGRNQAKYNE